MKFKIVFFPNFVKNVNGSLMGIALNLYITLASMAILPILSLPNHEHGMFFHMFVSSLNSLSSGMSLKRSFTSSVSFIPRYFILSVATANGSSLLIWLSVSLLLLYLNACYFYTIDFVS